MFSGTRKDYLNRSKHPRNDHGILKNICIEWVDVKQGDYILAHAGIAISVVDEKEAEETLKDLKELQKCVS